MKELTVTLTKDELRAVEMALRKFRLDFSLRKDAGAKAIKFDNDLISGLNKISDILDEEEGLEW